MTEVKADAITFGIVLVIVALGYMVYSSEWGQQMIFLWNCGFTDYCRELWELGNG